MNAKERVLAACNHAISDRTPITFDAELEVYTALHTHLGTSSKEELFDRLHVDTWMILPGNFLYPAAYDDKDEKVSIWGYKTRKIRYSGGEYNELTESPLAGKNDIDDIERYQWPSKGTLDFSHVKNDAVAHKKRAIIGVFTWGAYFIASFVRGMEDLLMDFAIRKDYAHCLIDTIAERCYGFLNELLASGGDDIDIVYMADDYCSQLGPLFSPDMFSEFVMPYLTKFVSLVHRHNKKFLLHVCGAVRPLLPQIIEAGVDMLEPIQIRASGMEPKGLKTDYGNDLCFYGGLDLQQILCNGSPDDVAREVRRLIDILGTNGGYVFGPGHTYIQIDAPVENILAMYDTAYSYRP